MGKQNKDYDIEISVGGKTVKTTSDKLNQAADAISLKGGGSNSQAIIAGYITELVKAEDELERVSDPIKAHIKDIKAAAKAAKANMTALNNSVKFKRASDKAREKFQQDAADTDLYLTFIQLSLFS